MSIEASTTTTTPAPGATAAAAPAATVAAAGGDGDSLSSILQNELDADSAALLADWTKDKAATLPGQTPAAGETPEAEADGQDPGADPEDGTGDEPEPEEEENNEGEDGDKEEEQEDEDGEEEPEPEATPVQKRINKLTAQKKELQAKLTALETEHATLKAGGLKPGQPVPLVPLAEDPLSHLSSAEDVQAKIQQAKAAIAWCKANKNGGQVPKEPGSAERVELTAEDVEATREEQEAILNEHAPARLQWLQRFDEAHAQALTAYPDVFKAGTKDNAFVREVIKHVPGLARHPLHELFIGDMIAGAGVRMGTHKLVRVTPPAAAGKAAAAPAPGTAATGKAPSAARPSLAASAAAPAPRPRGARPDTSATMERALKGDIDSGDAVDAMLAAKFG